MKTPKNEGMISKRIVLVSVMLLLSISVLSNTVDSVFNSSKGFLFLYYITGVIFFSLFLFSRLASGFSKNKNLERVNPEKKINPTRNHYHYYHKVIKKTA